MTIIVIGNISENIIFIQKERVKYILIMNNMINNFSDFVKEEISSQF